MDNSMTPSNLLPVADYLLRACYTAANDTLRSQGTIWRSDAAKLRDFSLDLLRSAGLERARVTTRQDGDGLIGVAVRLGRPFDERAEFVVRQAIRPLDLSTRTMRVTVRP